MGLSEGTWPEALPAVQVRMARPTDQLDQVVAFYTGLLGLPELFRNEGDGYRVVMVGLPGERYHLEFTSYDGGSPGTAPTEENLLVFYFPTEAAMAGVVRRFGDAGHEPVELDNPWWRRHGALAFADPDGWRIVLMPTEIQLAAS